MTDQEAQSSSTRKSPWTWIPTLYFASGLPNVAVTKMASVMYQNLGVAVDRAAEYTSDLMFPWVIKPLWSPLVDVLSTQRRWIVATQGAIALATIIIAFGASSPNFLVITLAGFWLVAIASATHDIAADGFYMAGLSERDQAWFVGIRNSLYRVSMVVGSGLLVWLSGWLSNSRGLPIGEAWSWIFGAVAIFFALAGLYHHYALPRPRQPSEGRSRTVAEIAKEFAETFVSFFQKPGVILSLAYLLLYRFSEAQLGAVKPFFMLANKEEGGLGLSNELFGTLDGVIGVILLLAGGILGGILVSRDGLRRWLFPMALAINLPNAAYLYLATYQPESLWLIGAAIGIEAFGYGFGFAGYMLYMLLLSRGKHQTAHYALCTGFMALGYQIPARYAGKLVTWLGYENFFWWVLAAVVPSLIITLLAPLREEATSDAPTADSTTES
ncbi:muropeptide transporter [Planctomycetes bacterium MalM25]|nr:muropeptide transporter [Planctomycetes bacterium MalM25]